MLLNLGPKTTSLLQVDAEMHQTASFRWRPCGRRVLPPTIKNLHNVDTLAWKREVSSTVRGGMERKQL